MVKTILVPLDGSTFGEHALPLALAIGRRAGAKLQLLRVQPPLGSIYAEFALVAAKETLADQMRARLRAADQSYLNGLLQRLGDPGRVSIAPSTAEGEIADAIRSVAVTAGADLVVMTTHGRGPLGRFWLGSVADQLVRLLPMPVLLVPPKEDTPNLTQESSLKHILLPLDGTKLAEQILPSAMALAHLMAARITLVRAVKPAYGWGYPVEGGILDEFAAGLVEAIGKEENRQRQEAEQYLHQVADRLRSESTPVCTRVLFEEQPGPAILRLAQELAADLIALETHGRRGLGRMILGSVADKVVRAARLPVLLHRPTHMG
jgi:nucleotide-binding universal stress UspA family protein